MDKYFVYACMCYFLWLVGLWISMYMDNLIWEIIMSFMFIPVLIISNLFGRMSGKHSQNTRGKNNG